MTLRFLSNALPSTATALSLTFAAMAFLAGCAGSKTSSGSAAAESMREADSSAKLEDARRSAEEAEEKAHQLREEKFRNQSKTSSN